MGRAALTAFLVLTGSVCAACSTASLAPPSAPQQVENPSVLALDLSLTRPTGQGAAFRPGPAGNRAVVSGAPVGALRCARSTASAYGAHVELFAQDHGVQVPAGIGVSRGRRQGPFVVSGRCRYQLSTVDPTGVVQVRSPGRATLTVGELFWLWGQPLSRHRLASFPGRVTAFVGGRRWARDPRVIPLRRHAQIVLEVGPRVPPHSSYLFPPGL